MFAAQEAVAEAVVDKLEPRLLDASQRRGARRPTENLAARNLYLQGRYHLNQRTDEGLHKALDFFEKAIVEDAQFALAHSGLADAHSLLAHYGVRQPALAWTKAASSAASAVMLDGNSARGAHVAGARQGDAGLGLARRRARVPARHRARSVVRDGPPLVRDVLPRAAGTARRGARRDAARAVARSGVVDRRARSRVIHAYRRDYEAALEQCDHTIELNPHFSPAYWALGLIQEQRKDLDEAVAAFQRAIDLSPQSPRMHAALARTLALSGKRTLAVASLRKLEAMAKQRYVSPFEFAVGPLRARPARTSGSAG